MLVLSVLALLRPRTSWSALLALPALGCQTALPPEPPRPPTPLSVTHAKPGGDAPNPERAALERIGHEGWGLRPDRQSLALVPLPDAPLWKRVKFWMVPSLASFRYGDEHHAVAAVFARKLALPDGQPASSDACLEDFEQWARPSVNALNIELSDPHDELIRWRGRTVKVRSRDGEMLWLLSRRRYAGVYASYPAWPGVCATLTYAFPLRDAEEQARATRDRFAHEAFGRFLVTATAPTL